MATGKKYYWLKLDKDFFKRHDIRIVEAMDNGKDYILFYLKLLCESTSHNGNLRFSETIPYDVKMLSVVTNTNIDIAEKSIKIFTELEMMETLDDGTIYMNEINKMLGYETDWAKKKRDYRESLSSGDNVPLMSPPCPPNVRQEKEIELDIEIEKEREYKEKESAEALENTQEKEKVTQKEKELLKNKEKENNTKEREIKKFFVKPSVEEVKQYCEERKNNIDYVKFYDFYESKGWMVGKNKMKDWKACVRTWERSRGQSSISPRNKSEKDTPDWYSQYEDKWKKSVDDTTEELTDAARKLFSNNN